MVIAGAGMAGLVAAARARELGLEPVVIDKGTRVGGSMLLSSGVVWCHLRWEDFYGRAMPARPARIGEEDFVRLAQLYGREARVLNDEGRDITPPKVAWHENDLAQLIGPSAWYVVERTNERIEAAREAGGTVVVRNDGKLAVHVSAGVTHTIG